MARKSSAASRCPTCKKPVKQNEEEFPFCSDRCRLIDLGKWASDHYVISSPLSDFSNDQIASDTPDED